MRSLFPLRSSYRIRSPLIVLVCIIGHALVACDIFKSYVTYFLFQLGWHFSDAHRHEHVLFKKTLHFQKRKESTLVKHFLCNGFMKTDFMCSRCFLYKHSSWNVWHKEGHVREWERWSRFIPMVRFIPICQEFEFCSRVAQAPSWCPRTLIDI